MKMSKKSFVFFSVIISFSVIDFKLYAYSLCKIEANRSDLVVNAEGALCVGGGQLQLVSWGDEARQIQASAPEQVVMDREGARWQRRGGLEEWHKASAGGVSHGWVVHAPMHPTQRELVLTLEAPGATPRARDAQSVVWEDGRGQARFDYSGLVAWDSEGRLLEARMEPHQGALRIKVDVTRASWPVTIDPVATAVITPPLAEANQRFGGAIAAHKEMVAVGAPGLAGGRVYIYRPNAPGAAQWSLLQELNGRLDANTLNIDQFGIAMDMKEDWLVVGTLGTGAYIYNRQNNNTWSMFKSIPSSSSFVTNGTYDSNLLKLGTTVKFIDDYLFITSKSDVSVVSTGDIISNSGVVAVYHKDTPSANSWGRVNVIFDTVPEINKEFGSTISGHGDWLIVSASRNNYVSLFKKNPSNLHLWNEHDKLVFPPVITPRSLNTYISSSDMKNGKMVFGIPSEANIFPNRSFPTSSSIGAVYYYEFDPLSQKWIYKQAFQPDIVSTYRSLFGLSVKIEGKTIVVGSPYYLNSQSNITHQNPVFIYKQNKNGTWIEDFLNTNLSATRALGTKTFLTDGVLYASDVSHDNIGAVHVRDFNTAPSVEAQQLRVMEGESGMLTLDVYDTEHEQLEVSLVQGPVRGNFQLVDGVLSYSAERSGPYTDTITYKVSDGKLETLGSVSIEVVNVNDPPVALAQQLVGAEDTALMVTLTGEDPDEGTQLGFEIVRGPEHGALMGQGATRTYMPAPNFSGEDSLTFKVSDGMVESAVAEVRIQVAPVNDPPVFVEPLYEGATRSEDGATIDLTFGAMDIDSNALVWSATGLPTNATFEAGRFVWTPTEAQQGTHNFELKVSDGEAEAKRTKQLVVVFIDANGNGVADVKERSQVEGLSQRGDEDGDGIRNFEEIGDPQAPNDTDKDGILDVFDTDSDGDRVSDKIEAGDEDPLTPPVDTDGDGIPDFQQVDADGDGIEDGRDNCRRLANAEQDDRDGNGVGDMCDDDTSLPFAPNDKRAEDGGCQQGGAVGGVGGWLWMVGGAWAWRMRRVRRREV